MYNLFKKTYQGLGMLFLLVVGVSSGAYAQPSFAVGSTTLFVHDTTRGFDSVGGIDSGVRVLPTEIWYPVDWELVNEARLKQKLATTSLAVSLPTKM